MSQPKKQPPELFEDEPSELFEVISPDRQDPSDDPAHIRSTERPTD